MSERSKGDTSQSSLQPLPQPQPQPQQQPQQQQRVVKNPLLSANVTGLTFDDFPNNPLLMPAAPPVVRAPTPPALLNRESPRSLVTVGSASNFDTESLDEINLNEPTEEEAPPGDTNANQIWEQHTATNSDSILSQAASSFSALPSVASSVFSTFSKRIYSVSSSRERTPTADASDLTTSQDFNQNPLQQYQQHQQQQQQYQQHQQQYQQHQLPQQQQQQQYQPHQPPQQHQQQQQFEALQPPQQQQPEQQSLQATPSAPAAVPAPAPAPGPGPGPGPGPLPLPPPPAAQQQQFYAPTPVAGNYFDGVTAAPQTQAVGAAAPPLEPPKFYTPSEVPSLPSVNAPPTAAGGQNTYRLSAKKKIYAPIPGLSDQSQPIPAPVLNAAAVNTPFAFDSAPFQPNQADPYNYPQADPYNQQQQYPVAKQEEKKGGLFSLTSFVPTGVLQNLSGLVQSAAGSLTQSVRSDPTPPTSHSYSHPYQQAPAGGDVNYIGVSTVPPSTAFPLPSQPGAGPCPVPPAVFYPTAGEQQLPQATNFFAPPTTPASYQQQGQANLAPHSTPITGLGEPPAQAPPTAGACLVQAPNSVPTPETARPPPQPFVVGSAISQSTPPTATSFFNIAPAAAPSVAAEPTQAPAQPSALNHSLEKPQNVFTPGQTSGSGAEPNPSAAYNPPQLIADALKPPPAAASLSTAEQQVAPVPTFDLNRFSDSPAASLSAAPQQLASAGAFAYQPPPPASASFTNQPPPAGSQPPAGFHPPPSGPPPQPVAVSGIPPQLPPAIGPTSFRLQKGTRLYKNPLTSAETAPSYVTPPLGQLQPSATPQSLFNPYNAPVVGGVEGHLAAPTSAQVTPIPNYFVPQSSEPESVPLFVAEEKKPTEVAPPPPSNPIAEPIKEAIKPEAQPQEAEEQQHIPLNLKEPGIEASFEASLQEQTIEPVITDADDSTPAPAQTTAQPDQEDDPLEQALQKFALQAAAPVPSIPPEFLPPPPRAAATSEPVSYRREPLGRQPKPTAAAAEPALAQPILQNFFTSLPSDIKGGGDFNFFATPKVDPPEHASQSSVDPFAARQSAGSDVNFFSGPSIASGAPQTGVLPPPLPALSAFVAPPPLEREQPADFAEQPIQPGIAPPTGFDNIVAAIATDAGGDPATATQPEQAVTSGTLQTGPVTDNSVNSFSNFFNHTSNFSTQQLEPQQPQQQSQKQPIALQDPTSFFDTFATEHTAVKPAAPPSAAESAFFQQPQIIQEEGLGPDQESEPSIPHRTQSANEDQRIQNFFNNPPPKENSAGIGDLNYDLVHSGLGVKHVQQRSLTPASNLVEPPSSSCSEFSELNNSLSAGQKLPPEKVSALKTQFAADPVAKPSVATESDAAAGVATVKHYEELPEELLHELRMANVLTSEKGAASAPPTTVTYSPAVKHWFYKRLVGSKHVWTPFSHYDSALLETSSTMDAEEAATIVAVEGGRYDVNVKERTKVPVYWEGEPIEVRRCSWFYKATDSKYVPYEEQTAEVLEAEYKQATESGEWHKKIILSMGEQVVFHGPTVIVHFHQQQNTDAWGGTTQTTTRPRVVKRDLDDFTIEQGESQRVDHLLFMVHGIGSACDLKMRTVEEVVDDFRVIAQQLVQSHYKNSTDMGLVGRVEVLPISWHSHLHSEEMGIDEKLKAITLESIPKLRNFTNDTLLDILFYTSPTYCQKIMNTVATAMNVVYQKYRDRHPDFTGGVSLAGHSLGSLIVFDLLCHQTPIKESEEQNLENPDEPFGTRPQKLVDMYPATNGNNSEIASKQISYTMGPAGTGQPFIHYGQLAFQPKKFFALGSPIGMFVTIRGIDKLGLDFRLPTCPGFYNIFHPFDPVAYRIEALINPEVSGIRPVLIPHHKGRKRMHLELKETMSRVGADLKQRFMDTFKTTFDSVNFLGTSTKSKKDAEDTMKEEVGKVLEMQMELEHQQQFTQQSSTDIPTRTRTRADSTSTVHSDADLMELDLPLGKLNDSKRVDYVLQEAPLEFFNEYLFALSSHVCYWESEDTILFVMKEIYAGLGISPDSQVPQQTMSIERPSSRNSLSQPQLSPTT